MENIIKVAVLGFGGRGKLYSEIIAQREKNCKIVAVCDSKADKQADAQKKYGLPSDKIFAKESDFWACGKIADVLIIATMDGAHYKECMTALRLGYDVLLEKPISPKESECREIVETAERLHRKIAVCHVLRYTPVYDYIKRVLQSGEIGDIVTVSQTENVGYWHQAHSFVRGNWRDDKKTCPMILQKCCHDMDVLRWLIGKPCVSVSSYGSLSYFKSQNAPENAAERCVDCKVDCIYNAVDFYMREQGWFQFISNGMTDVKEAMRVLPNGRCVFKCDNNVVDHQVVNLLFEEGVTAQLTMTAFSDKNYRRTHIYGTKGEIETIGEFKIRVCVFGKEERVVDVAQMGFDLSGHGGGDIALIREFMEYCRSGGEIRSSAKVSLESHIMAFAAEKSRLKNGEVVKVEV